jgi:hypothetical protein
MRVNSLATRMTVTMRLLVAVVLGSTGTVIGLRLRSDLSSVIADSYSRLVKARADEVGKFLGGHWDEIAAARAFTVPVTSAGIIFRAIFQEGKERFISDVFIPQIYTKPVVMLAQKGSGGWIVDERSIVIAHPQAELVMKQNYSTIEGVNAKGESTTTFYAGSLIESLDETVGRFRT